MKRLSFVIVVALVGTSLGIDDPIIKDGSCATVQAVEEFNATAFSGRWYMMQHYPMYIIQNRNCVQTTFILDQETKGYAGEGTSVDREFNVFEDLTTLDLVDPPANENDTVSADFIMKTIIADVDQSKKTPYKIISIDYENYACIYACQDDTDEVGNPVKIEFPMIYWRDAQGSSDSLFKCENYFAANVPELDRARFMTVAHDDCEYEF